MKKDVTIIVNGQEKAVAKEALTFEEVVELGFRGATFGDGLVYTVTYRKGHCEQPGDKPAGILTVGQTLKVKEGMIIDVTKTDKS